MKKFYLIFIVTGIALLTHTVNASDREPVVVTVQGNGTVTSSPSGLACPSDCFENYREKISVTLTAQPGSGSHFLGWSGACSGKETTCVIKILKRRGITATFSPSATE